MAQNLELLPLCCVAVVRIGNVELWVFVLRRATTPSTPNVIHRALRVVHIAVLVAVLLRLRSGQRRLVVGEICLVLAPRLVIALLLRIAPFTSFARTVQLR